MAPELVQRMNADVNKVLLMPDIRQKLDEFGAEDAGGPARKFADFIASENVKWAQVIKDANVRVDS